MECEVFYFPLMLSATKSCIYNSECNVYKFVSALFSGRMFIMGLALGPFNHYWYIYLDKFLPGIKKKTIFKKVILDEVIASPFFLAAFFVGKNVV